MPISITGDIYLTDVKVGTMVIPPVARFTASPTSGTRPLTVNFTDTSTNYPTSWLWNFGDGATSTARNPSHTYTSSNSYTATLHATNSSGTSSVSHSIAVNNPAFSGSVSNVATASVSNLFSNAFNSSANEFVVWDANGTTYVSGNNGSSWYTYSGPSTSHGWYYGYAGGGKIVTPGRASGGYWTAQSSDSGRNWTMPNNMPFFQGWQFGVYVPGNGIHVMYNGSNATHGQHAISYDNAATWQSFNIGWDVQVANANMLSNGMVGVYVTAVSPTFYALISSDGVNYSQVTEYWYGWSPIEYGNGTYVMMAGQTTKTSSDLSSWTTHNAASTGLPAGLYWVKIAYGNGKFVAIGNNGYGTGYAAYSSDGIAWTSLGILTGCNPTDISYGNGAFIISGTGLAIYRVT